MCVGVGSRGTRGEGREPMRPRSEDGHKELHTCVKGAAWAEHPAVLEPGSCPKKARTSGPIYFMAVSLGPCVELSRIIRSAS